MPSNATLEENVDNFGLSPNERRRALLIGKSKIRDRSLLGRILYAMKDTFLGVLPKGTLDNHGTQWKAQVAMASLFWCFGLSIFVFIVEKLYTQYRTQEYISLSPKQTGSVCNVVPKALSLVVQVSQEGYWQGDNRFLSSNALYEFEFIHAEFDTLAEYNNIMRKFQQQSLVKKPLTYNFTLAENYVFVTTLQHKETLDEGYTITMRSMAKPATVLDGEVGAYSFTSSLANITHMCNTMDIEMNDNSGYGVLMSVAMTGFTQYLDLDKEIVDNPYTDHFCDKILPRSALGYTFGESETYASKYANPLLNINQSLIVNPHPKMYINVEYSSHFVALAVNLGLISISDLTTVEVNADIENAHAFYVSSSYPDMRPIKCCTNESSPICVVLLKNTDDYGIALPIFQNYEAGTGAICNCDATSKFYPNFDNIHNESDIESCNSNIIFRIGLLQYYDNFEKGDLQVDINSYTHSAFDNFQQWINTAGSYSNFMLQANNATIATSNIFNLTDFGFKNPNANEDIIREWKKCDLGNDGLQNVQKMKCLGKNVTNAALAQERQQENFAFCNGKCTFVSFIRNPSNNAITKTFFELKNGSCSAGSNIFLSDAAWDQVASTPPMSLQEAYYKCTYDISGALVQSVGIAISTSNTALSVLLLALLPLLLVLSEKLGWSKRESDFEVGEYTVEQKKNVIDELAFHLLRARDGYGDTVREGEYIDRLAKDLIYAARANAGIEKNCVNCTKRHDDPNVVRNSLTFLEQKFSDEEVLPKKLHAMNMNPMLQSVEDDL